MRVKTGGIVRSGRYLWTGAKGSGSFRAGRRCVQAFDRGQELMQGSVGRTLVLTVFAVGAIAASLAGTAVAQDGRWWEAFPGFGGEDRRARRASDEEPRRGEAIDDL